MALLILWEVDHGRAYPSHGGEGLSGALTGFTRRLQERVAKDEELSGWLGWKDVQAPLSAGLAPSHHRRWAVRVLAPVEGEPRGWYEEFVARWRAYLEILACPRGSRPLAVVSTDQAARIRPLHNVMEVSLDGAVGTEPELGDAAGEGVDARGRARPEEEEGAASAPKRRRALPPPTRRRPRPRSPALAVEAPAGGRQRTLSGWLRPSTVEETVDDPGAEVAVVRQRHGRAVEGPPT
jgi:uncharacterized protein YbaR (Trm112 family)